MSKLWRQKFFIKWSMTLKVIQGHEGPLLCQNPSCTFVYGPIFMKICMNVTLMKTQFFIKLLTEMSLYVMEKFCDFFTLIHFGHITTLTSVLMDNFCNCFKQWWGSVYFKKTIFIHISWGLNSIFCLLNIFFCIKII